MAPKIKVVLTVLDRAKSADDVNVTGFRLHPLKGELKGFWSVTVEANWRIIFRFENGNTTDIDLVDYH
jgi:toxin HigB-1